jgi:RNA polymerase sigma-70 factor (ECF subfamily)
MKTPAALHAARVAQAPRSDAELMRALATGDLGPLGELYDRYHDDVLQFARRACSPSEDHDDVVHDAFLTAARAAASYDGRPCARPFLVGVAGQILRQRRRLWVRWSEVLKEFVETRSDVTERTPEDDAAQADDTARVTRALKRLTAEKRLVLLMIEREGLTGEEVAGALGIPLGTVWTRLHHARAELRRSLKRREA